MKNNNRGFLVTGMLYSLLLLFLVLMIGMLAIMNARQNKLNYISRNIITKLNDKYTFDVARQWEFDYTGNYQTFTVPTDGYYNIELWGAQGGNMTGTGYKSDGTSRGQLTYTGGKGAYTKGVIYLTKGETIYIYVGGAGSSNVSLASSCSGGDAGGYNGGGTLASGQCAYGASGGGATDVRLVSGEWNNFDSLKSRIMVAAGGGGANFRNQGFGEGNGGAGGAFYGVNGSESLAEGSYFRSDWSNGYGIGTGGTQTSGGYYLNYLLNGTIYHGNSYDSTGSIYGENIGKFGGGVTGNQSGGGSGYYAGGSVGHGGAGGGSSFVSGLYGVDAISESSTSDNIVHTGQSKHYSGKIFYNGMMIAGDASMPTHAGSSTMIGNEGNGYAKISLLSTNPVSYTATNMVKNGSYESGTNSWNSLYDVSVTDEYKYFGENSLKMDVPKTYSYNYSIQTLNQTVPKLNHKYYGRIYYYSPISLEINSRFEWWIGDSNKVSMLEFNPYFGNSSKKFVVDGNWNYVSDVSSVTVDTYLNKTWILRNFTYSITSPVYADGVTVIDLTETFGAGNEPSKEWCDQNISYFDGTITIYK